MLNKYKWQKIAQGNIQPFIDFVNSIDDSIPINAKTAEVRFTALPFYNNIRLVEIKDRFWPQNAVPFWFLEKDGRFFLLDGSSAPIHDANEAGPVWINEENILAYLDFFCFFVHGEDGPFFVVEDINHPALDTSKLDSDTRDAIENALFPARYDGKSEEGTFVASAVILYGKDLFSARFALTTTGMIEMIDDDCIADDLPVKKIK